MSLIQILGLTGIAIAATAGILNHKMSNYDSRVLQPQEKVSIIMPSYNEAKYIEISAASVRNQDIVQQYPDQFEFILVDSGSTDNTLELAKPYFDKIITAPRGKLTARNLATNLASGDLIVSVDGDSYYPQYWLNSLLEPFNDKLNPKWYGVVAVSGSTYDDKFPRLLYLPAWHVFYLVHVGQGQSNFIVGRNSAYYKYAHYLADGFNEHIDQFDFWKVNREEESLYGKRLSNYGNVIYKLNAPCYHLGGQKDLCRLYKDIHLPSLNDCNTYKFGTDRF